MVPINTIRTNIDPPPNSHFENISTYQQLNKSTHLAHRLHECEQLPLNEASLQKRPYLLALQMHKT